LGARAGEARGADGRARGRGRPLRGRPLLRELVGRARRRGLVGSVRAGGARALRGVEARRADLFVSEVLWRAGEGGQVTPEAAGWRYLHFGVRAAPFSSDTGDGEIALVPLGGRCRVEAEGEAWELGGRASVFDGMPWALYLPRDTAYRVEGDAEVAICGAS